MAVKKKAGSAAKKGKRSTKKAKRKAGGADMKEVLPKAIQWDYVKDPAYRMVPISGVVGHAVPESKSVFVSLFQEHLTLPQWALREVLAEDTLGPEQHDTRGKDPKRFTRHVQVSLVMNAGRARSIGKFLIDKADEVDRAIDKATEA